MAEPVWEEMARIRPGGTVTLDMDFYRYQYRALPNGGTTLSNISVYLEIDGRQAVIFLINKDSSPIQLMLNSGTSDVYIRNGLNKWTLITSSTFYTGVIFERLLVYNPPNLKLNINGAVKEFDKGWVNVNGQLKEIDKMWTNVNGVLREI